MQETTNLKKNMSVQACIEQVQKLVAVSYPCAKAYVHSFGCQLNVSDGEKIKGLLQSMGFSLTKTHEDADLIVFNTCAVRESAEDRVYGMLGIIKKYKETHPRTILILSGCMGSEPKTLQKIRAHYSFIDILMGTASIGELPRLLAAYYDTKKFVYDMDSTAMPSEQMQQIRTSCFKASVPIMYGCNNFCTYCIVPYTRGRERSRLPEVIIKEVKDALADGFKEITLLGQNVDSYGKDFKDKTYRLADLLKEVNALEGNFRIRFVTSYPTDITDELIETARDLDKVCEYFHIPMQSGSSRVLKAMNRRYDRETYAKIVEKVRKMIPDVTITSDFIAGFPGETEEEFVETLTAIDEFELDYSNVAAYSPREKTVAAKWVDKFIPEDVKDERFQRLNLKVQENCLKSNLKYVGREMEVLIENFYEHKGKMINTGKTRNFKTVHIPCDKDLTGQFVNVKISDAKTWYLKGKIL